jgi:hypothetical protein
MLLLKKNLIPLFDVDSSILPFFVEGVPLLAGWELYER